MSALVSQLQAALASAGGQPRKKARASEEDDPDATMTYPGDWESDL